MKEDLSWIRIMWVASFLTETSVSKSGNHYKLMKKENSQEWFIFQIVFVSEGIIIT